MSARRRAGLGATWALVALAAGPLVAAAQPGPPEAEAGWPPLEIGARVGLTNIQQDFVLGALLRVPVWRTGHVEVLPSADITFLGPLEEYQFNLEAVYLLLGRDGGPYLGGGIGLRNTLPPSNPTGSRETLTTYNVVVGLKLTGLGRVNPMFEFRRAFVPDLAVDPQLLSLGATIMLW
jgi:hypothetical protein